MATIPPIRIKQSEETPKESSVGKIALAVGVPLVISIMSSIGGFYFTLTVKLPMMEEHIESNKNDIVNLSKKVHDLDVRLYNMKDELKDNNYMATNSMQRIQMELYQIKSQLKDLKEKR